MSTPHNVEDGDFVARIAGRHGYRNFNTIWKSSENDALRASRESPNILMPGDRLVIPDKLQKKVIVPTGRVHQFVVPRQSVRLRIALLDYHEQPLSGASCELELEGAINNLRTDDQGLIEQPIPVTAQTGALSMKELAFPLKIGYLHPIDETTGWQARLLNLGYLNTQVPCTDPEDVRSALEEFQCDHSLPVSGGFDGATRDRLKSVYGC